MQHTSAKTRDDDAPFLRLDVRLLGRRIWPQAAPGFRVLELLKAFGVPVKGECGGSGVCATCHVRVPEHWRHRLPPPSEEELAKLDEIPGADDSSRLACQIMMADDLDGLEMELDPDSISVDAALKAQFLVG